MGVVAKTKGRNFETLMGLMKKGYRNINAINQYCLKVIQEKLDERQLTVSELAEACFLGDFSNKPAQYLEKVLNGTKPMTGPVLCRLNCILELRGDAVFPFKRIGKREAYEAEKQISGRDIREDPIRKDYNWRSLGAVRCFDLMDVLYD